MIDRDSRKPCRTHTNSLLYHIICMYNIPREGHQRILISHSAIYIYGGLCIAIEKNIMYLSNARLWCIYRTIIHSVNCRINRLFLLQLSILITCAILMPKFYIKRKFMFVFLQIIQRVNNCALWRRESRTSFWYINGSVSNLVLANRRLSNHASSVSWLTLKLTGEFACVCKCRGHVVLHLWNSNALCMLNNFLRP